MYSSPRDLEGPWNLYPREPSWVGAFHTTPASRGASSRKRTIHMAGGLEPRISCGVGVGGYYNTTMSAKVCQTALSPSDPLFPDIRPQRKSLHAFGLMLLLWVHHQHIRATAPLGVPTWSTRCCIRGRTQSRRRLVRRGLSFRSDASFVPIRCASLCISDES